MKIVVSTLLFIGVTVNAGFAQVPFFQDKTITVVLGGPPAGSADLRTRAVVNILANIFPAFPPS